MSLAGKYTLSAHMFHDGAYHKPGDEVELSEEDAARALSQKTVIDEDAIPTRAEVLAHAVAEVTEDVNRSYDRMVENARARKMEKDKAVAAVLSPPKPEPEGETTVTNKDSGDTVPMGDRPGNRAQRRATQQG
jgi:hypothetical protein